MNGIGSHSLAYASSAEQLCYGTKHYSYRQIHLAAFSQKEKPAMSNKCTVPAPTATKKNFPRRTWLSRELSRCLVDFVSIIKVLFRKLFVPSIFFYLDSEYSAGERDGPCIQSQSSWTKSGHEASFGVAERGAGGTIRSAAVRQRDLSEALLSQRYEVMVTDWSEL